LNLSWQCNLVSTSDGPAWEFILNYDFFDFRMDYDLKKCG
jgi:hypothetical protein